MCEYFKHFFKDGQRGIETIEFIALTVVAAVLITIVAAIGQNMVDSAQSVENTLDQDLDELMIALGDD